MQLNSFQWGTFITVDKADLLPIQSHNLPQYFNLQHPKYQKNYDISAPTIEAAPECL